MFRAAIRWCLAGLLLVAYVPLPAASGPAARTAGARHAACCAPKAACCTADHACSGGGACVLGDGGIATHGGHGGSMPLLRAGSCHPEATRAASALSLDPIVFAALPAPPGSGLLTRSGVIAKAVVASRSPSPRVPPPRA